MNKFVKAVFSIIGIVVGLGLLIQLIPYGKDHTNPPIVSEPKWDSPQTRELAQRACFDCHSNETKWPWYTNVAPVSWLTYHDTTEGRSRLNFSDWGSNRELRPDEISRAIQRGEMPPAIYTPMHPTARLTAAEKHSLLQGLQATIK